jgi:hypothetical protein
VFVYCLILAAVVYAAVVAETVVESARFGGRAIISFGTILYLSSSSAVGVEILTGLSATATLALVAAVGYGRGRRLERRMAAEVDQRWEQLSREDTGLTAGQRPLDRRAAELQTQVDRLTEQRNALRNRRLDPSGIRVACWVVRREVSPERTRALSIILILVALGWTALVADVIYETATADQVGITLFGSILTKGTAASRTVILALLAASAVLLLAIAIGFAWRRSVGRRTRSTVRAEVARGVGEKEAGMQARHELLAWRISELEKRIVQLESEQTSDEDMQPSRRQAYERSGMGSGERRILNELARAGPGFLVEVPDADETQEASPPA